MALGDVKEGQEFLKCSETSLYYCESCACHMTEKCGKDKHAEKCLKVPWVKVEKVEGK